MSARGRIRRETLQCEKEDGGLKAPNIMVLNKAIKYKVLLRSIECDHPIKTITHFMLERKNLDFEQDFIKRRVNKSFLDTAMNTHDELNRLVDKDLITFYENIDTNFHRSYYQFMANHKLNISMYITQNQRFMERLQG